MKHYVWIGLSLALALSSCKKEEEVKVGSNEIPDAQNEQFEKESGSKLEQLKYEGTFEGTINGKEVKLELEGESFKAKVGGKRVKGDVERNNAGNEFELNPTSGSFPGKFLAFTDIDNIIVLTENGEFPEDEKDEQYLVRTK